jgi:hypothetical protein
MSTLTVRNIEQAAAWLELDGQLSDGYWENASPDNHWKVWSDAYVRVAAPGELTGRDFFVRKDNYNFSAKDLLDAVGLRMLGIVRIARQLGLDVASLLEHSISCDDGRIDWTYDGNWASAAAVAALLGINWIEVKNRVDAALADETYTMKHLRADLNELKMIVKNDIRSYAPKAPVAR